jgi:hypothetical protein
MLMLTKRKKIIIGSCLLPGILFCVLGCIGIKMMAPQKQRYPQEAQRSVVITIDTSHRQEFFDQLRKFADKHDFKILIDTRSSGSEDFLIEMTREDIEISGANVFAAGEYQLGFYHADLLHPAPESTFDDLISDLESFINEVPDTTFSVEK